MLLHKITKRGEGVKIKLVAEFSKVEVVCKNRSGIKYFLIWTFILNSLFLILAFPIFSFFLIILPITNLIFNPGPLFYFQSRLGQNGRVYIIWKFRTMRVNAELNGAEWAKTQDNRVTKGGLLMRSTRLDELPQVINILKGEMNLIGPRPERPELVRIILNSVPDFNIRLMVKPGLTGLAQVCQGYASTSIESAQKLKFDMFYIKNKSICLDLLILFKTITVVWKKSGW